MKSSATLSTFLIGSLMLLAAFSSALVFAGPITAPGMCAGGRGSSWSSTNWSGYVVTGSTGSVTSVAGSWIVPTVSTTTSTTFAACWVGIDGFSSNTVEQIGTLCSTGDYAAYGIKSAYCAWYEFYPAGMVLLPSTDTVSASDVMNATVTYTASSSGSTATYMVNRPFSSNSITSSSFSRDPRPSRSTSSFTVTITDKTADWTFTTTGTVTNAARSSAEWITEAPSSSSGVLPLANFGTVSFGGDYTGFTTTCYATVSGATGSIKSFGTAVQTITMVTNSGVTKASPSPLSTDGTSFTVTWQHS